MAELAFIPFDGQDDTKKRKKKREAIRVHVMKNFHRQRKREAAQHRINRVYEAQHEGLGGTAKDSNPSTVANAACRQGLSDSLIECYGDENSASLSIPDYSSLANFRSDRSLLPIFQAHEFIDQHVAHVEQSSALLSSNPKFSPLSTDWLPASRAHSHLFHASVFVCTASTETLAQRALSPSSFYHRGLAIRMINEQLSDSVQCMSDETIAAIISLANFECIIGNTSSLKYHVTGLLQLAAMRGGLDQLGMNGLLKRLILIYVWFLEVFSTDTNPIPESLIPPKVAPSGLANFHQLLTLEPTAAPHPASQSPLYLVLKATFAQPIASSAEYSSSKISSRLHALDMSSLPPLPPNLEYIPRTCRLACLLYHSAPDYSTESLNTTTYSLRDYLERSNISTLWLPFPGALLWCLMVGIERAKGDDVLYAWFAAQLMRCWVPLAMHRWEGLERALEWFGILIRSQRREKDDGDGDGDEMS